MKVKTFRSILHIIVSASFLYFTFRWFDWKFLIVIILYGWAMNLDISNRYEEKGGK
jgi:hypothetical protein